MSNAKTTNTDAQPDAGQEAWLVKGPEAFLPLRRAFAQGLLALRLQAGFDLIDLMDQRPELLHGTLILGADDFADDPVEHD